MVLFTGKLTYGVTVEEMREFIDSILNDSESKNAPTIIPADPAEGGEW